MTHITPEDKRSRQDFTMADEYKAWLMVMRKCAIHNRHRLAIAISGSQQYCYSMVSDLITKAALEKIICLSDHLPGALRQKQALTQLGQEYDAIVFDMYSGFDPDAFGAISGTLVGGGIFFLLIPDKKNWLELKSSRFLQMVLNMIRNDVSVHWLEQGQLPPKPDSNCSANSPPVAPAEPFRTVEQRQVVEAIELMAGTKIPAAIVLMSDRGRGKSAALGLAAGRLLQQGVSRIVVTAPRMSISEPVFRHARQVCAGAVLHHGQLDFQGNELVFIAPDALLEAGQVLDLLLVDEAAAIPLPMLEALLSKYPSIVFATTVHGYEGTGRGFALKFDKVLDKQAPGWQLFPMSTPVRWADADPVEAWVDHLLCLDADLPDVSHIHVNGQTSFQMVLQDRDSLINDSNRLRSLFAILVNAHYRTRPSDLQYMLDSSGVRIYTLENQGGIVAAVLINEEGGFDAELSRLIYRGERRPSGHLLAQTLSLHAGCESASTLSYSRIMRIAVHPKLQRQGLGSQLLKAVMLEEKNQPIDAIGSCFGATVELIKFWENAGFTMVRLGFTRDHASGTHSAVMLFPVSMKANPVLQDVRSRFQRYLPVWIDEVYKHVQPDMSSYLQKSQVIDDMAITDSDWKDIYSFAYSHRGYESCMWSLSKLVRHYPDIISSMSSDQQAVINTRIVNKMDWQAVAKTTAASGKADVVRKLRQAISSLLEKVKKDAKD
ncbi:MAG: tRNA(Met) cytidine acetyltransferase TmcA [Gammaproteobacteria bacterium]